MAKAKAKPLRNFRHASLEVTVWETEKDSSQEDQTYLAYAITLKRSYKTTDDTGTAKWESTQFVDFRDIPAASLLLQRAYGYIANRKEAI